MSTGKNATLPEQMSIQSLPSQLTTTLRSSAGKPSGKPSTPKHTIDEGPGGGVCTLEPLLNVGMEGNDSKGLGSEVLVRHAGLRTPTNVYFLHITLGHGDTGGRGLPVPRPPGLPWPSGPTAAGQPGSGRAGHSMRPSTSRHLAFFLGGAVS